MLQPEIDQDWILSDVEVETIRRAAILRNLRFDAAKRAYKTSELNQYGIVREAFNSEELAHFGIDRNRVVTSFDPAVERAREHLVVDAPFATNTRKWQLPIDVWEGRTYITEFAPNTHVKPHVHPANSLENPGGSLRIILGGSLHYAGKDFGPGDWFYIPNGVPYAFRSGADQITTLLYKYAFFGVSDGNRLSSPLDMFAVARTESEVA
jgi:hypothetical protein